MTYFQLGVLFSKWAHAGLLPEKYKYDGDKVTAADLVLFQLLGIPVDEMHLGDVWAHGIDFRLHNQGMQHFKKFDGPHGFTLFKTMAARQGIEL